MHTLDGWPSQIGVATTSTPDACAVPRALKRRRRGGERLFGYWDGRRWQDVHADDVNAYLREASGTDMTAKDFHAWHATVLAATRLAVAGPADSASKRKRTVAATMREVADLLGNTQAVARASYVDPRLLDFYEDGRLTSPGPTAEQAVLELLDD